MALPHRNLAFGSALLMLVACGDSGEGDDGAGASGPGGTPGATAGPGGGSTGPGAGGGGGAGSGGAPPGTTTLVTADWSLEPGTEIYQCTRRTLTEDLWVTAFYPTIPQGTHHTVVSLDGGGSPDGTKECGDPFEGGPQNIYGTGVGSKPMMLPPGVAVKIASGQQVVLNLHLFNAGGAMLSGTSAIEVSTASPDTIENEARLEIWGKAEGLTVPPNTTSTQTAACTVSGNLSLFVVQPHMHQLGKHLKVTHQPVGSSPSALFDADYSFDAQVHLALEPAVALAPGDQLGIECTYDNPTPTTVGFGESSNDEMCFAGLWVYPANEPFCN